MNTVILNLQGFNVCGIFSISLITKVYSKKRLFSVIDLKLTQTK